MKKLLLKCAAFERSKVTHMICPVTPANKDVCVPHTHHIHTSHSQMHRLLGKYRSVTQTYCTRKEIAHTNKLHTQKNCTHRQIAHTNIQPSRRVSQRVDAKRTVLKAAQGTRRARHVPSSRLLQVCVFVYINI